MHGIYCAKGTSILLGTARGDQGGSWGRSVSSCHLSMCSPASAWQPLTLRRREEEKRGQSCSLGGRFDRRGGEEPGRSGSSGVWLCLCCLQRSGRERSARHFSSLLPELSAGLVAVPASPRASPQPPCSEFCPRVVFSFGVELSSPMDLKPHGLGSLPRWLPAPGSGPAPFSSPARRTQALPSPSGSCRQLGNLLLA